MSRIETVFRKESQELWTNRPLVYSFMALVLFFVLVPVLLLFVVRFTPEEVQPGETSAAVKQLARLVPGLEEMPPADQAGIVVVRHFILIFLVLPVIGALGSSTSSIVGEKQSRSMEPVLATPVTTLELLAGKSLACVSLAVSGTWFGFLIYTVLVLWVGGPAILQSALDLTTLMMVFLLTPLIALLGLGAGVVISSRVKDSRSAQQIGGLLVLPIVMLIVGQMAGLFVLGPGAILVAAIVLTFLDLVVMRLGVRVFDREKIISEWK
jgi:ABC-2 type transport system permease protein